MLIEPHFRVPFLSCWSKPLRSPWLRLWGKGRFYDCEPLELHQLRKLIDRAGLRGEAISVRAFRAWMDIETPRRVFARGVALINARWLERFGFAIPTHVSVLRKT